MKKQIFILLYSLFFLSCEKVFIPENPDNTPMNNFELLWNTLDTKYALFEQKNIDWDSVYNIYRARINNDMNDEELFPVLNDLLMELKDGHTDFIETPFGGSGYFRYDQKYKDQFSMSVIKYRYLQPPFSIDGPLFYGKIGNTGYIQLEHFTDEITYEMTKKMMNELAETDAIIIDLRRNIGGNSGYADRVTQHFFDMKRHVKKTKYKNGPDHNEFVLSDTYFEHKEGLQYLKPVVVLTSKVTFSAGNGMVTKLSALPHVTLVGDTTGGGGGRPYHAELANGWIYRFSGTLEIRPSDSLVTDNGIPPDVYVRMYRSDLRDVVLDYALELVH